MKIADLYIRVSTDEQADKGYSQRSQEETLRKYCQINCLQIGDVIYEDFSAKTFNRPRWIVFLSSLKKHKTRSSLLLFTKWDRFSRNAGDAYQMINTLRKVGIEPQAIEQPLDLSIPENKMMLAFYLAAPEVENDRRALNVFFGMRRAKKEGRWMSTAPVGYVNKIDDRGCKYITCKEPEASIVKWAFEELSKGIYAADQIRKEANRRGLKCSRSTFWRTVRNPVYFGRIAIKTYKHEEALTVLGQHRPIISEALFYDVQEILSGKKRKQRQGTQINVKEEMPLRGFLICPQCGHLLTGSASKGKYNLYYYYHCNSKCGIRFRTDKANNLFEKELKKYVPRPGIGKIYESLLKDCYAAQTKSVQSEKKLLLFQIDEINKRLRNAREMVADQKLDPDDFREIKLDCMNKSNILEAKLSNASNAPKNIDLLLSKAVGNLGQLDTLYEKATVKQKRQIISSIFPEKLVFDGLQYRTPRINECARLIYSLDEDLREIKNRKGGKNLLLSGL